MEKGNANGVSVHGPARPTFTGAAVSPHHPLFVSENLRLVGEASCRGPEGCSLELGLPGARVLALSLGDWTCGKSSFQGKQERQKDSRGFCPILFSLSRQASS